MKNNGSGTENRWKKAVDKFRHALGDPVDSVRVRISEKSDHSDWRKRFKEQVVKLIMNNCVKTEYQKLKNIKLS